MPPYPFLTPSALFTLALSSLLSVFFVHPILAQKFQPTPNNADCSAFIEGQGFYVLGGLKGGNFMIDLSVSWNTSDPVFKKLEGGPKAMGRPCATTNDELFVIFEGIGHLYNVRSASWREFRVNGNFLNPKGGLGGIAVADPEAGNVYLPANVRDVYGNGHGMLSANLRTHTFNISDHNIFVSEKHHIVVWNAYWKSMLVIHALYPPDVFTPSQVSQSSTGWDIVDDGQKPDVVVGWACGVPAYGGTKMIFLEKRGPVYVWDVVKNTWKKGPLGPKLVKTACAITGDQFILWGGMTGLDETLSNKTYVYNMKSEKWTSRYVASPLQPITITAAAPRTLRPSQTPTHVPDAADTPDPSHASFSNKNTLVIAAVVIGVLVAVNLGFIFRYYRRARRSNPDGPPTYSLDLKEHFVESSHQPDPPAFSANGRIHQGPFGARELSEHPHAILEDPTAKCNLQEGAVDVELFSQHPHAMVGDGHTQTHSDKAIQGYNRHYGDKEELIDQ